MQHAGSSRGARGTRMQIDPCSNSRTVVFLRAIPDKSWPDRQAGGRLFGGNGAGWLSGNLRLQPNTVPLVQRVQGPVCGSNWRAILQPEVDLVVPALRAD
jgi:hypothetical protein